MKPSHFLHIVMLGVVMLMGKCNPHGHGAVIDLDGHWKGAITTPHMQGKMELVVSHTGNEWGAYATLPSENGLKTQPLKELHVTETEISFVADIHGMKVSFKGKLDGQFLAGSFDGEGNGAEIKGTWKLSR